VRVADQCVFVEALAQQARRRCSLFGIAGSRGDRVVAGDGYQL
jgi:hypothetical protein